MQPSADHEDGFVARFGGVGEGGLGEEGGEAVGDAGGEPAVR